MKKIFAILMTICLLAGALSITAFAAEEPAEGVVMRVSGVEQTTQNAFTTTFLQDFDNFQDGWNYAMGIAGDEDEMEDNKFDRILVEIYADWSANTDGEFTEEIFNGAGFKNDTIYIPSDAKVTLNLNGKTINRNLEESENDGEVIYIDDGADVIINNGTITGGKSTNGAGGIHIHDAKVELNDVHIVGNIADNDDGGGIALYDGAELIMTRGSFTNNSIDGVDNNAVFDCYGGAIYIENSKAFFYSVEFNNNQNTTDEDYGAAIYADNSVVYLSKCTFDGNGVEDESKNACASVAIVYAVDTTLTMEMVTFTNNGSYFGDFGFSSATGLRSTLIALDDSTFRLSGGSTFTNNGAYFMISVKDDSNVYVEDTTFENNKSFVMFSSDHSDDSYFKNCTFENNKVPNAETLTPGSDNSWIYTFRIYDEPLKFIDCKLSDSTYFDRDCIVFEDTDAPNGSARRFGSIFGEGSLSMIVALLALIASGVSIFLTVYYNKKKAVPVVANNATETEDEE